MDTLFTEPESLKCTVSYRGQLEDKHLYVTSLKAAGKLRDIDPGTANPPALQGWRARVAPCCSTTFFPPVSAVPRDEEEGRAGPRGGRRPPGLPGSCGWWGVPRSPAWRGAGCRWTCCAAPRRGSTRRRCVATSPGLTARQGHCWAWARARGVPLGVHSPHLCALHTLSYSCATKCTQPSSVCSAHPQPHLCTTGCAQPSSVCSAHTKPQLCHWVYRALPECLYTLSHGCATGCTQPSSECLHRLNPGSVPLRVPNPHLSALHTLRACLCATSVPSPHLSVCLHTLSHGSVPLSVSTQPSPSEPQACATGCTQPSPECSAHPEPWLCATECNQLSPWVLCTLLAVCPSPFCMPIIKQIFK